MNQRTFFLNFIFLSSSSMSVSRTDFFLLLGVMVCCIVFEDLEKSKNGAGVGLDLVVGCAFEEGGSSEEAV